MQQTEGVEEKGGREKSPGAALPGMYRVLNVMTCQTCPLEMPGT